MSGQVGPAEVRRLPSGKGAANGRNIGSLLFRGAYKLSVIGADLVPRRGRVIFAANHTGFLDGPLLFSASPRPLHLVAKSELFQPPFDRLLCSVGQIPLQYESADRAATQAALAVLTEDRALGIFPEAHRGLGDFANLRHGIAYLAIRTNSPIVPVALLGTRSTGMGKEACPKPRSKLAAVFGEPFRATSVGDPDRRSTLASAAEAIRQRLVDHVRRAQELTGLVLPTDDVSPDAQLAARYGAAR